MVSYIWEVFVCLIESLLIIYLLYKKIGLKAESKGKLIISIIIMTGILSALTLIPITTIQRMTLIMLLCTVIALWTFDCGKKKDWYKAALWPSCYLIIVTAADSITFTIAGLMVDFPLETLMSFGSARVQFTLIYLLLVTVMVWALGHIGEPDPDFPWPVSVILLLLLGIGIFAAESILDIALVLGTNIETQGTAQTLTFLSYGILLMLFSLLITFEWLGVIIRKNKELKQQRQLALIEQQQYELLVSAAESLADWKHDYQGQLRLIGALIEEERYGELNLFAKELEAALPSSASLLLSGNRTVDAVISLRMMDAKRHHVSFESKLFLPERIPLSDVAFASLLGNVLDNAIEACRKVDEEEAKIYFEIKPWKQMMYLYCVNTSNGKYIKGGRGQLLSTKQADGHGIGIRRIQDIVEEAGGTCRFTPEEKHFCVSIMIPLEGSDVETSNRRKRSITSSLSPEPAEAVVVGAPDHS